MKKITLLMSALLFTVMSFAAALGEGYAKVTDITTLTAGDKVVLYCDAGDDADASSVLERLDDVPLRTEVHV